MGLWGGGGGVGGPGWRAGCGPEETLKLPMEPLLIWSVMGAPPGPTMMPLEDGPGEREDGREEGRRSLSGHGGDRGSLRSRRAGVIELP